MNKLLRKIFSFCVILAMLMCVNMAKASADEPVWTYGVEYSDGFATITFYTTIVDAFDIAVAYDPSMVSVKDCGYTTQFKELQVGGKNTTISVLNDDAKDDAGNTYMVFTGAGADMESGKAIDFAGKPLAYVTFEGNLAEATATIVTDSATVSNVYEANKVAEVKLGEEDQTIVTPEPIADVVYEDNKNTSHSSQNNESVQDSTSVQNPTSDNEDSSSVVDDTVQDETNAVDDESETEVEKTEGSDDIDTEEVLSDDEGDEAGSSISPVILGILIGIAVILIIAIIIVVTKKKKISK